MVVKEFIESIFDAIKADMLKTIGFNTDMQESDTSGTAIECIENCALMSPDIINNPFIRSGYENIKDISIELFLAMSVGMAIMYLLSCVDSSHVDAYSKMITIFKNSFIFLIGIHAGLFLTQMMIQHNYELSIAMGGMSYIKTMLLQPGIMGMGLICSGLGVGLIFALAVFYILRAFILLFTPFLIAFVLILWFIGKLGGIFEGWCEGFAFFILRFCITNCYLGFVMVVVFSFATWLFKLSDNASTFGWIAAGWVHDMCGVLLLIFITFIPFIALIMVVWNPIPTAKNIIVKI